MSKTQLNSTVNHLANILVTDPNLESAFLGALGNMEEVAAREIIKSITEQTPQNYFLEIIQHAQDEHRHAFQLRALKPVKDYTDIRYYYLERKLSELGIHFVLGFFGQQLLMRARSLNRFAGYVHGALTIEQVPLQLYAGYLKATKINAVRAGMPAVLKDEFAHLELGKALYATLPKEQQMDIDRINAIELEMCELLARKMIAAIDEVILQNKKESALEDEICADKIKLANWIFALSKREQAKGNLEIADLLAHSVSFITNKVENNLELPENIGPLAQHYQKLADRTDLIGVAYALEKAATSHKASQTHKAELAL